MGGSSGSARTQSAPGGSLQRDTPSGVPGRSTSERGATLDSGPAGTAPGGGSTMPPQGGSATNPEGGSATNPEGGSATMGGGSSPTLGAPGGGTAPGSSRAGTQQSRMPEECSGPVTDPRCGTAGAPTGTGLGDRGTGAGDRRPYGPEQSPVQGGPPFTGPTGRPLDLPREGR